MKVKKRKDNFWTRGGYFFDYVQRWVSQYDNEYFNGSLPAFESYDGFISFCYEDYMQDEHPLEIELFKMGIYLSQEERKMLNIMIDLKYRTKGKYKYLLSEW